eukprot:1808329-Ditylum_brightwellii.AAC.1
MAEMREEGWNVFITPMQFKQAKPPLTTQESPPVMLVYSNGALSLAVHLSWAPIGAQHFLDL